MAAATSLAEIAEHIKKMRFKKKLFGGVDEEDVWKQIRELDADYRNLFKIQNQIFKMELARAKGTKAAQQKSAKAQEKTEKPTKATKTTKNAEKPAQQVKDSRTQSKA